MTLPTFIVIGAMKGGTTALHQYLDLHPDVFVASPKELNYFVGGAAWSHGGEAWYRSKFEAAGDALARGECSPNYTKHPTIPGVPERMAALLPDARLVYVLRHPLERTIAHYLHFRSRGGEHRSAERAISEDARYVDASLYGMQLERYLAAYPKEQLLVIRSEDLRNDPTTTLATVHRFIGVGEVPAPEQRRDAHRTDRRRVPRRGAGPLYRTGPGRHALRAAPAGWRGAVHSMLTAPATPAHARLSPATTATLVARFRDDLDLLRQHVGDEFEGWALERSRWT